MRTRRAGSPAWLRGGVVVGLIAGALLGGWGGSYMRSSGMFFSDLFVGAILIVVVVIAGIAAAVAAKTRSP